MPFVDASNVQEEARLLACGQNYASLLAAHQVKTRAKLTYVHCRIEPLTYPRVLMLTNLIGWIHGIDSVGRVLCREYSFIDGTFGFSLPPISVTNVSVSALEFVACHTFPATSFCSELTFSMKALRDPAGAREDQ